MKLSEKLKKLRQENHLTQDEFAEKIFVTRTAVSKWETDHAYPSIDSLKMISSIFSISLDDLISDDDIENQKLLDDKKAKRMYFCAMGCFVIAAGFALMGSRGKNSGLYFAGSILGVLGYIAFGLLSVPRYKRAQRNQNMASFILSRIVVAAIVIVIMITIFMRSKG